MMKGKKILGLTLAASMTLSLLTACGGTTNQQGGTDGEETTAGGSIKVAAIETSYVRKSGSRSATPLPSRLVLR